MHDLFQDHFNEIDRIHHVEVPINQDGDIYALKRELSLIQRSMSQWKGQTVEKMAKKFQDEMTKEIERFTTIASIKIT